MRFLFLLILLLGSPVWADSETINPDSVSTPDQWNNVGGANKVVSVTDDVDANLIEEISQGQKQRFTMKDPENIGENDKIDSIVIYCRLKAPSGTGVVARVNHIVSSTTYGTSRSLAGSWVDYYDTYSQAPEGGDWSLGAINDLKIEADAVTIPVLKKASCTKMHVTVYYTPAAPVSRKRTYQQLMLMGE